MANIDTNVDYTLPTKFNHYCDSIDESLEPKPAPGLDVYTAVTVNNNIMGNDLIFLVIGQDALVKNIRENKSITPGEECLDMVLEDVCHAAKTIVQIGDKVNGFTLSDLEANLQKYSPNSSKITIITNIHSDIKDNDLILEASSNQLISVKDYFSTIKNILPQGMAVDIALFSCYSQRAQCDITYLPPGSRLLTISGMDSELKKCELCSYLPESYDVLPAGFMSKHLPSAYYSEVATGQTSFDITHLAQIFMFMPHSEKNFPVIGAYDENNQQAFKQYNLKCEAAKVEKFECTISAKQFNDCFLNAPGVEVNNTRVYNMQVDVAHLNNEIYKQLNGSCTETAGPGGGGGCGYSFKATSNLDALELPAQTILGADNLLV